MIEVQDTVSSSFSTADYPADLRVRMLLLNMFPLVHLSSLVFIALANWSIWMRIGAFVAALFLLPPLLSRTVRALYPLPPGKVSIESGGFLSWWATAQFQIIFNRIPMIEEVLRMIPGVYSNWLRLWGSRIGRFTYWSPGTVVLDREYLDLGNDVVFGAGVRLNGHVIMRNQKGHLELAVAPIKIGSGAAIGGYSLLTAGTEIAAGESTRAHLLLPPFTVWRDGKRMKGNLDEMD